MNKKSQAGQASRTIIILAIAILMVAIVGYVVTRVVMSRRSAAAPETTEEPKPVYEVTLGDVRLIFESARDMGNTLYSSQSRIPGYAQNIRTTEKFIKVTIRAQNKGKLDLAQYSWDLGGIIDSEGRNYIADVNKTYYWLPQPDFCGALLKPEFEPIPCVRIYEVSRAAEKLQVYVSALSGGSRKEFGLLDLKITK